MDPSEPLDLRCQTREQLILTVLGQRDSVIGAEQRASIARSEADAAAEARQRLEAQIADTTRVIEELQSHATGNTAQSDLNAMQLEVLTAQGYAGDVRRSYEESASWKLGRLITWPARTVASALRSAR